MKISFLFTKNFIFKHKLICVLICTLLSISLLSVFLISAIVAGLNEDARLNDILRKRYRLTDNTGIFVCEEEFDARAQALLEELNEYELQSVLIRKIDPQTEEKCAMCIMGSPPLHRGRGFTDEEIENGQNKIIISNLLQPDLWIGDTFEFEEESYDIIGLSFELIHLIPYDSSKLADFEFNTVDIMFEMGPSRERSEEILQVIDKYFPECMIQAPDVRSKPDSLLFSLFFVLFVVTIINLALIYDYVLEERVKSIRIMKLCGAANLRCASVLFIEVFSLTLIIYIPTSFISVFILPKLLDFVTNGYLSYAMQASDYLLVFIVYAITVTLVFFPKIVKTVGTIAVTSFER